MGVEKEVNGGLRAATRKGWIRAQRIVSHGAFATADPLLQPGAGSTLVVDADGRISG
jgi:hypothetical protein